MERRGLVTMRAMNTLLPWFAVLTAVLLLAGYEAWLVAVARARPHAIARTAHALLRAEWVASLSTQPGSEILAVQTLRNSLMSATIAASTAALALMGTLSLTAAAASRELAEVGAGHLSVRLALELLLLATLFASYVCSAMAMRFFNHAGYVMSMPIGSPQRTRHAPMAARYVRRAGLLYSWGLRLFLYVAPVVAGLLSPWAMPVAALVLLGVLRAFDIGPGEGDHGLEAAG